MSIRTESPVPRLMEALRHGLAAVVWAAGRAPWLTALAFGATLADGALAGLPVLLLTLGTTAAAHGHWGRAARDLAGYALAGPAIGNTLGRARSWVDGRLNRTVAMAAQEALARALADVPYEAFEGGPLQGRVARARDGLSALEGALGLGLALASAAASVASVAAVLGRLSPVLAAAACATPVVALADRYHRWATTDAFYRWWSERQRAEAYHEDLLLHPMTVKELRAFGAEPWILGRWRAGRMGRQRQESALQERATLQSGGVELLRVGLYLWAMGACSAEVLSGRLAVGALTGTLDGLQRVQGAIAGLAGSVVGVVAGGARAGDLFAFLREARAAASGAGSGGRPVPEDWAEIRLEGAGYRYPGGADPVLRSANVVVRRGCLTALVGVNGAGKTTALKLLTGLLEPDAGRVTVGGVDLRDVDRADWWRRLAPVFQGGARYALPLRDGVGMAQWAEGGCPDRKVREALRRAGLDADVALERPAGTEFAEDGVGFSGGQWQRLDLARVYCHSGAEVVILDEPSSALDPDAEEAMYQGLRAAVEGGDRRPSDAPIGPGVMAGTVAGRRTGILVSHRLGPVRFADHIVVLDGQTVAEQGTHDELLAAGGLYARMFKEQQAMYG